ncbi:hypothetical protein EOD41_17485 [Mucilaginibacter limnophilus]|uniref:Uncharacterized protein n=1 Tax=Mucilaginibacter limnophilus TaxID=1932778 RepID=A0A3S2UJV7_9SPHI|nr:hypothetical protein [Mucilaginibacter limnophilus]RVT98164.1 hypothetical protein EOD41_17485 [Mucilaginibacter limnophilus]
MKIPKLILLICYLPVFTAAQSVTKLEADLLRAFDRIDYWYQNRSNPGGDDSLENANVVFGKKLKNYTGKYSFTISHPFNQLTKAGLKVVTSADGLLRIYSWDTSLGGTMHKFRNIAQYKSGTKVYSTLLITDKAGFEPFYSDIYPINTEEKTYYLSINKSILSSAYLVQGVRVFTIEHDKLNINAKLIKTKSGLNYRLDVDSDLSADVNKGIGEQPELQFYPKTQALKVPLITSKGKITNKFIVYKFTGKYFERIK